MYYYFIGTKMRNIIDISYVISSQIHGFMSEPKTKFTNICCIEKTCPVNVSQVSFSTHVGTHIDAPSHYIKNAVTIDQLPLEVFIGSCMVIEVEEHIHITKEYVEHKMKLNNKFKDKVFPTRILFKTASTNLYNNFPKKFPTLTPESIKYLSINHKVVLIGIDTPSIDPIDSKNLPAHHACYEYGINIIEGLNLSEVDSGLYTLVALPLRLEGLDASPVRAVLIKNFSM
jgi:arylformamidase